MNTRPLLFLRALLLAAPLLVGLAVAEEVAPAVPAAPVADAAPDAAALAGPIAPAAFVAGGPSVAGVPAAVPATLFSFRADAVPIKQALALFARANNLNIVPDLDVEGEVTVEFRDLPLDFAMQALLDANGYYFVQDGRLLRVRNREARLFQVDYIQSTRSGQGSNAVQISSAGSGGGSGGGSGASGGGGGASGSEGSTMTVTNTSTINFWGELSEQLKALVSETGSFTVNSLSGTILVRDRHRNIQTIADYLANVTQSIVRQVDLEVEIYEVALNNSSQLGINWQKVSQSLDTSFNTIPGQLTLPGAGGLIVQSPVFGGLAPAPGIRIQHQRGSITAVLDALKQQGNLKIVSKPRLRTLNNQPAVVRIGQDLPVFVTQITQSPGSPPVISTNESIQTITVGTVLSITPQISADGLVTLDITPAVSRLVRTETSATGNTNAPVIDIRQASSIVRVRDGATIIMGGLVQDSSTSTRRKVPLLGDIPLLGKAFTSTSKLAERTELIFFLTPRIINDAPTEASAPRPAP
ncbi:MAG: secretin N-terminal domain-containing protein [Opitutaceae bacterium]|nr:secretin N-terminal domain-containing protein [Opitutaceae bacterium]